VVPWIVDAERARAAERHAAEAAEGRLVLVEADVADAAGAARVHDAAGEADVLVNGVGGFAGGQPLAETPLEVFDRMYRMNLRTAVCLSQALVPGMCARGGGAVVNVAAQAAWQHPAGVAAYSASKAGVVTLTGTLQSEVAERGVRVNAVAPGTIDTPANREGMPGADRSGWTPPEAIARTIVWLAADVAAAVRGAVVPV